jgi:hypothetical protein
MKASTKAKRLAALDAKIARLAGIKDKTANRNRTANAEYDAALQERTLLRNWPVTDADDATDVGDIDTDALNGPEDDSKPADAVENSDANDATGVVGNSGEVLPGATDADLSAAAESGDALDATVEPGDDSGEARENAGRRGGRRARTE